MARFATVSESDIDAIVEDKNAASTKKATETLFNVLLSYCKEKCLNICVETMPKQYVLFNKCQVSTKI